MKLMTEGFAMSTTAIIQLGQAHWMGKASRWRHLGNLAAVLLEFEAKSCCSVLRSWTMIRVRACIPIFIASGRIFCHLFTIFVGLITIFEQFWACLDMFKCLALSRSIMFYPSSPAIPLVFLPPATSRWPTVCCRCLLEPPVPWRGSYVGMGMGIPSQNGLNWSIYLNLS